MKTTVVPAQVTTVEDRVMGSLGFSQLLLLVMPIIVGGLLYAVLPPTMGSSLYKVLSIVAFAAFCAVLAVRIKGKIVLFWAMVIFRYNLRPKYYIFNKNSSLQREQYDTQEPQTKEETEKTEKRSATSATRLGFQESLQALATINDPARHLHFETTKRGGLNVRFTEVED